MMVDEGLMENEDKLFPPKMNGTKEHTSSSPAKNQSRVKTF